MYSGRFNSEKRVELILNSFLEVKERIDAVLLLIGEGPLKKKLLKLAGKDNKIFILPFQNQKKSLAKFLASSDVYISANPHETFGLSILEAQACGVPVVGVCAGALIDRVDSTTGALAEVDSQNSLTKTILKVCGNNYREQGEKARQVVAMKYSWKFTFDRTMQLYESLSEHLSKTFPEKRGIYIRFEHKPHKLVNRKLRLILKNIFFQFIS